MKKYLLLLAILASSCAFPSTKEGMTLTNYESPKQIGDKICVKESKGGSATLPFWTSEISDEEFTAAIKQSLLNSKAFLEVSNDWNEDWGLEIEILDVDQPLVGATLNVNMRVKYILYFKGKKEYETTIFASDSASISDTLFAVKRLRLANEKSAKKNIHEFVKKIAEVGNLEFKKTAE